MDNKPSGTGNQYDYGFRIYDARIAKFLSVDPLTSSYPWYTPYQFAGNTPIEAIDLDGLEPLKTNDWRMILGKWTNPDEINNGAYSKYQSTLRSNFIVKLSTSSDIHGFDIRKAAKAALASVGQNKMSFEGLSEKQIDEAFNYFKTYKSQAESTLKKYSGSYWNKRQSPNLSVSERVNLYDKFGLYEEYTAPQQNLLQIYGEILSDGGALQ